MKTFTSTSGSATYLVLRTLRGGYHVFVEVEAKEAAVDCGAPPSDETTDNRNTEKMWDGLWEASSI